MPLSALTLLLPAAALLQGATLPQNAASDAASDAASPAAPASLPEVVVSAERREGLLRRTPVSVGVVDSALIERRAIRQLSDLVGTIAGVTVPNGFTNMPQAVGIRGVGVSLPAMAQAVGIYVDDVPLVRGYATALWDLPDIARIEVLRGPQGTLYGQNSSAGAVKIVSLEPSAEAGGWVSGSLGNFAAKEAHGYVTGPLGDAGMTASLAASTRHNDGFGYNANLGKDINKLHVAQFRAKLRQSFGGTVAQLALDGLTDNSDINATNYPLRHVPSAPRVTWTARDTGQFGRRAGGISLKLTHALDERTELRSITALRAFHDDPVKSDWGGLEIERYWFEQTVEQQALSQEFQWQHRGDRLTMTAGAIWVGDRFEFHRNTRLLPVGATAPAFSEAQTRQSTRDLGVYAQGRYAWTPATGLTLGLRAYRTRQGASNEFWRTDAAYNRTATVYAATDLNTGKNGWLPRVGLDHQIGEDHFLYASLAKGAKFGGFNRAAESLASAGQAAQPEQVTTYEAGSKSRLLDGALTLNTALFYNDYRDYLAQLTNTEINGVRVSDAVLINAGKARTYGVDVDITARLARSLDWTLSLEYLRSRFDSFLNPTGAANTNYVGNELPNAPRWSVSTGLVWQHTLPGGTELGADLTFQFIERQFSDVANSDPMRLPRQSYVHLGARVAPAGSRWSFSLRVRNLQDRAYAMLPVYIPALAVDSTYWNAPRTVLVTARYDF